MLKRHSNQLDAKIEELVITRGWVEVRLEELRLWFDNKVTKNVWREIRERIQKMEEELEIDKNEYEVLVYDGLALIINSDGKKSLDDVCT